MLRGVEPVRAEAAARGLPSANVMLDGLSEEVRGALLRGAQTQGLECLSGDGWVLLAGSPARLAALVRPGRSKLPTGIGEELAGAIGGLLDPVYEWRMANGAMSLEAPVIVGILNITPDSFSDGGAFLDPDAALRQAEAMVVAGAAMLDLGAESTRPGAVAVDAEEEWSRLGPVLDSVVLRFPDLPISVDTVKAETARRALDAGAWAINDVSALRLDAEVAQVCATAGAGLVLMHSRGSVAELATYDRAVYGDVVAEVIRELRAARRAAIERGVGAEQIVLDPGLGFAKTPEHTFKIFRHLPSVAALGHPVMVGPSRKRFLGAVTGRDVGERDIATAAAVVAAHMLGASIFRVHAVAPVRDALMVANAVRGL